MKKVSWHAEVDSGHAQAWQAWKDDIILLGNLLFARCYKPADFGKVQGISLHTFGDGCNIGYGAATYLRQVDQEGRIAVSLSLLLQLV